MPEFKGIRGGEVMSLVILRSEYLKLIQAHSKLIAELPKAVQFCAAMLIQYFQHWSNWKQNVHRPSWIYQPFRKIKAIANSGLVLGSDKGVEKC